MEKKRFKNWWFLAVNGIISILFGLLLMLCTEAFIKTVVIYIGIFFLLMGIGLLITSVRNINKDKAVAMILFESIISLVVGTILIIFPGTSLSIFLIMFGTWAIIIGIIQLVILVNIKGALANKNGLLLNGLLTIVLGVILFFNPFAWAIIIVKIVGAFAVVFGLLMIYFSFLLRSVNLQEDEEIKTNPDGPVS